jgi:hypothetical protein
MGGTSIGGALRSAGARPRGFVLPLILISSVVFMVAVLIALQVMSSAVTALRDQAFNQLAQTAADDGAAFAKACMNQSTTSWLLPLTPATDCAGKTISGLSPDVVNHGDVTTTFSVSVPLADANFPATTNIIVTGTTTVTDSSGKTWGTYTKTARVQSLGAISYTVSTLAGTAGQGGNTDGVGSAARFDNPGFIAVARQSSLYDTLFITEDRDSCVRMITQGNSVSTVSGTCAVDGSTAGLAQGTAGAAKFSTPVGVTTDSSGNAYVVSSGSPGCISKIAGSTVSFVAGGCLDSSLSIYGATGIVERSDGSFVITNYAQDCIQLVTSSAVTALAGSCGSSGTSDGTGSAARFNEPFGLAQDSAGNLYVADNANHCIRKISPSDVVTTLAGLCGTSGQTDGVGSAARFDYPQGVAIDPAGNLYVADTGNNCIRKITSTGVVTTIAGTCGATASTVDGTGSAARFNTPYAVAVSATGALYVTDYHDGTIRELIPNY